MKMIKQNEIKLANILVNGAKREEDYYFHLTDSKEFGFADFTFTFDVSQIQLRYFGQHESIWKCVEQITEDDIDKIQPAFDKLREVLTELGCIGGETKDEH